MSKPYYIPFNSAKKSPEDRERMYNYAERFPKLFEHKRKYEKPSPSDLVWPRPLKGLTKFPLRPNLRRECGFPDPAETVNCCCGIKPYPCCPAMRIKATVPPHDVMIYRPCEILKEGYTGHVPLGMCCKPSLGKRLIITRKFALEKPKKKKKGSEKGKGALIDEAFKDDKMPGAKRKKSGKADKKDAPAASSTGAASSATSANK